MPLLAVTSMLTQALGSFSRQASTMESAMKSHNLSEFPSPALSDAKMIVSAPILSSTLD
jgi:hypothetical protein